MGFAGGVWLVVLGVLGAANLIVARRPDAEAVIGKIAPYQGWIGAISALWGVWMIVSSVLNVGWLAFAPIYWATFLASGVLQAGLGLLLGIGVLKQFTKAPAATERMDSLITRLAPYQGVMGLAAIGVGAWMFVSNFLFSMT